MSETSSETTRLCKVYWYSGVWPRKERKKEDAQRRRRLGFWNDYLISLTIRSVCSVNRYGHIFDFALTAVSTIIYTDIPVSGWRVQFPYRDTSARDGRIASAHDAHTSSPRRRVGIHIIIRIIINHERSLSHTKHQISQ